MRHASLLALSITFAAACASAGSTPPRAQPATPGSTSATAARPDTTARSIAGRTAGMEKRDGFLPLYLDGKQGKLFLELPRDSMRVIPHLCR